MTAQNVYSGFLCALPLKGTTPSGDEGSAAVFEQMLNDSARDGQGPPKTVTTDGSTVEWSREFKELLEARGIIHRVKEPSDANAMGKLDATQQRLRALLRPNVDGSNKNSPGQSGCLWWWRRITTSSVTRAPLAAPPQPSSPRNQRKKARKIFWTSR